MNILWIYLGGTFIVTIIILVLYLGNERSHTAELDRIKLLEQKMKLKHENLMVIRAKTQPCRYKNLNDPRSCYMQSNFVCTWNEEAERCDQT